MIKEIDENYVLKATIAEKDGAYSVELSAINYAEGTIDTEHEYAQTLTEVKEIAKAFLREEV